MTDFEIEPVHKWWAEARPKRHQLPYSYFLALLKSQNGLCALSHVPLVFGDGNQLHPLFAEFDHREPGSDEHGHQIICRALNAIKGRLPLFLFEPLTNTPEWLALMTDWRRQAAANPSDSAAFERLLKTAAIDQLRPRTPTTNIAGV